MIPFKTKVPDVPVCTGLSTRPESKVVKDIGRVVLQRPNPTCMKEIGEPYCGYCVWTTSNRTQFVGNKWNHLLKLGEKRKTWDTVVEESLVTPAESQAEMKAFAINVCKLTKSCEQEISRWRVKLDALDSVRPVIVRQGKSLP